MAYAKPNYPTAPHEYFLDTSSLIKLYDRREPGAAALQQYLGSRESIYLSALTQVEFVSALGRKQRRNELTTAKANDLQRLFEENSSTYGWIDLAPAVLKVAAQLLGKYTALALRSLDAVQLASAIAVRPSLQVLITHDHRLHEAAVLEGFTCWPGAATVPPPPPAAAP